MDSPFNDKRFSHIAKDPRFRSMPKKDRKVKIDKRFQGMFKDDRFKLKYSVDKKGRPVNKTSEEDLKRFYELSDDENESSSSESESEIETSRHQKHSSKLKSFVDDKTKEGKSTSKKKRTKTKKSTTMSENKHSSRQRTNKIKDKNKADSDKAQSPQGSEEELLDSTEDRSKGRELEESEVESEESGVGTGPDLARGEGNVSSSEDEEEDDWQPEEDVELEHNWGEADKNIPEATELGRRLAVCNMDWDRIKARDLYVLFSSFKPTGGIIHSVKIYPSEFGEKMMRQENTNGPGELIHNTVRKEGDEAPGDGEGSEYHMERLRQYQLNRLKYYYAVVECDSMTTASHIYDECDGLEYETSSAKLDLRFIPDDMEFDQEPHSVCKETPDSATFEPSTFLTTALCQSKVELTWDETDRDRVALTKKIKPEDINDDDFKAYLASSSEDEADGYKGLAENSGSEQEEDEQSRIDKYKSLLQDIEDSERQKEDRGLEMEITWEPGLKEATEEIVKKKGNKKEQSVWESYLEKKKEKKQKKREEKLKEKFSRKAESKQSIEDGPAEGEAAFSDDELPEGVDMDDPYFKSELEPTHKDSNVKKKKKGKKQKIKLTASEQEELDQKKAELSLLMMDEDDVDNRQHFSLQKLMKHDKVKTKRKRKTDPQEEKVEKDTFQFDVDDSRFQAMYSSHLFNVDPSAPEFKRTKVMDTIINEKLKRRKQPKQTEKDKDSDSHNKNLDSNFEKLISKFSPSSEEGLTERHAKDPSISALVNSIKTKTKNFYKKKSS